MRQNSTSQLNVFISSTTADLAEYRKAVIDTIGKVQYLRAIAQEQFGISHLPPADLCREKVSKSHIFVGLIGHYRGTEIGLSSHTELEFEAAVQLKLPRFMCVQSETAKIDANRRDDDQRFARQQRFRQRIKSEHVVGEDFSSPAALSNDIIASIFSFFLAQYNTPMLAQDVRQHELAATEFVKFNPMIGAPSGQKIDGRPLVALPAVFAADVLQDLPEAVETCNDQSAIVQPIAKAIKLLIKDNVLDLKTICQDPRDLAISDLEGQLREQAEAHSSSEYFAGLASVLSLRSVSEAAAAFGKASDLAPYSEEYQASSGNALMRAGQYQQALLIFRRLVDSSSIETKAAAWANIGTIQRLSGDSADAVECYKRAIALERQCLRGRGVANQLLGLGHAYQANGRLKDAVASFEASFIQFSELADILGLGRSRVGLALCERGRNAEAEKGHLWQALGLFNEVGSRSSAQAVQALLNET